MVITTVYGMIRKHNLSKKDELNKNDGAAKVRSLTDRVNSQCPEFMPLIQESVLMRHCPHNPPTHTLG